MSLTTRIGAGIGVVMVCLGTYIALHPLWSRAPVTTSPWLDMAFALFFLVKGWLYLRRAWRAAQTPTPDANQPS